MKQLILIITILVAMTAPAMAEKLTLREVQGVCKDQASFAETTMWGRQHGWSMEKSMKDIKGRSSLTIIGAAFNEPVYQDAKLKLKAMEDFSNKIYLNCFTTAPSD